MPIYHTNLHTDYKFVVDFQCFREINLKNHKYPQKQDNLDNFNFQL